MEHKEFYEYGLLPGVHYVSVANAEAVPAMVRGPKQHDERPARRHDPPHTFLIWQVRWLKEHDEYARSVAAAGRARMAALDSNAVADYMAESLRQYAGKWTLDPDSA
jgi:protein glucosyltransferase